MRVNISRTRAASGSTTCVLPPEPADDRRQDDHRDVAVDVEEGDVEAGEVARAHERVLVDEQRDHHEPADPEERTERQHHASSANAAAVRAWPTRAVRSAAAIPKRAGTER